jgi:hypothetical protein
MYAGYDGYHWDLFDKTLPIEYNKSLQDNSICTMTITATGYCGNETKTYELEVKASDQPCGNGIVDPGEDCDPNASASENSCGCVTCPGSCICPECPKSWLMTAFGDSYALGGYPDSGKGMRMYNVSTDFVPLFPTGIDEGYFSTYIISKGGSGSRWPEIDSKRSRFSYIIDNYNDNNRNRTGGGFNMYNQLESIAIHNGCFDSGFCSYGLPASGKCERTHVYFNNGKTAINTDFTELPSTINSEKACIIVSKGNIIIGSSVNTIQAILFTDGTFTTQRVVTQTPLFIHGSVYTNKVNFQRVLTHPENDPAEIIIYNPKYMYILKEMLGIGSDSIPLKIREYKYSTVSE